MRPDDGRVIALVNGDVASLLSVGEMVHETWAQLLEVAIGVVLLARRIGWITPVLFFSVVGKAVLHTAV